MLPIARSGSHLFRGDRDATTAKDLEFTGRPGAGHDGRGDHGTGRLPGKDGRLAFGARIGDNVDVYSMKENGNDLRRLTDASGFDICAAYSADGNDIAFCSNRTGSFEIWTMKANGTGERQVTVGAGATFPDYSPDGSRIAYGGFADGNSEVYVIDADGTDVVQLTSDPAFDELPAWSPDGSKIAFLSDRTGMSQVWLMDSDGSDQTH